ncbi:MAG TPA: TIGR04013 family B12-binding domain/radical SAM domain-containing protein [Methanotrichaceae archaeon]|nr:MAG: coproporphyrinogen III oxidase [Methanosaeta sp. PtaU1.Bin028]HOT07896.1 TIGR04013 family B12-binding domain/radical SAM domain-containing protein [Methanotrichaceae archaeon]HQF17685.1 TIGR04013 family B12-binding domain/radical SAM domain-containing protein [Methanotrichaceae archaeon]HQI92288.1 TIGR04013 family B12-binding domain/radical SAM domain-containing protein [Methanotrichaceae archaeon]HQJ29383.1 TIGR04013 family B12-binding domain/radical SAM domain-containing protein [Meth
MTENGVWFRWNPKNRYSIASLWPLLPEAGMAGNPRPGIMLYSLSSSQAQAAYLEVDHARKAGIEAIFVAGGPHPSARAEEALQHFDCVVIGEGEESLPKLVAALQQGRSPDDIRGIAYRERGRVRFTSPNEELVDLDRHPPFQPPLIAPIEISRGCPWGCAFCQTSRLFGPVMRHRSIECIMKYAGLRSYQRFTSPNALAYGSDGRRPRLDRVESLLRSLHELGQQIFFGTFPCEVRPEFVTEPALDLIERYCANRSLSIGGQSGSDRVLQSVGRGHNVHAVEVAVERCLERGILPKVDLILGLPAEIEEDQNATLDLGERIVSRGGLVRMHRFMPLPGTPLQNCCPANLSQNVKARAGKLTRSGQASGKWFLDGPGSRAPQR